MTKIFKTSWMCGFCNIPFTNNSHCLECNRYDGAMTKKEWKEFNKRHPLAKVSA